MVDTDKIGTSVYFWAFPSKASASQKRRLEEAEVRVKAATKRLKTAEEKIFQLSKGREDTEERQKVCY